MITVDDEVIQSAEQRARARNLPYRGALTPSEAWELLQNDPSAKLLDVRSNEELNLVGRVPGAIEIELKRYPKWTPNSNFLAETKQRLKPENPVFILCRSAQRSHDAAIQLTRAGFTNCFNILEGFEGDKDAQSRRIVSGWKAAGLPWQQ